ncbi:MAG: energy-coupling factor transporter ATPase [Bifidobacterium tibiigranuli]|uniref:energy-coupling factor transporter ATPase n=1 Tax=Bifidobacterium tibiigranuli TaxID=2172043 RepID=UPI0026EC78E8|nr:energy-coupling factor transporter ATPase [Bifidobacterium tibiigranuli]MCI1673346.1 energy-coupling factor transporter ATPase [Bifidobacterium tibiigranuli]MCI1712542.1 energy-coupling factor transporter ATPase [Bifidobacterium tibiigranuli]MCI1834710.1 energy-coupling factor transporter ATPase [Bifidobacterium tibiigranuli]
MISTKPLISTDSLPNPTLHAVQLNGVRFSYDRGKIWALDGIDLTIRPGERICLTGPNGSGKSTLSRIIAGLVAPDCGTVQLLGHQVFDGAQPDPQAYRQARHGIGAVFQNPEDQIVTTVVEDDVAFGPENLGLPRPVIAQRLDAALGAVDMAAYRHGDPAHMSGGQQQRIAIAGTLAMAPSMIVLDEPTAMLDSLAQAEVMSILDALQARGTTIVHVTHRSGETAHADRVIRMEHGRIVADTTIADTTVADAKATDTTITQPAAAPLDTSTKPDVTHVTATTVANRDPEFTDSHSTAWHGMTADWQAHVDRPAIEVSHVSMRYANASNAALDDLSLTIEPGETVAIMGRNGSGKTTLARLLAALEKPSAGTIRIAGIDPATRSRRARKELRRQVGLVMQRPERQLFAETVAEDIAYGPSNQHLAPAEVASRVQDAMMLLHISHLAQRSPASLSGGQQRLAAIAGVIACQPGILIMDEPTASLDTAASARIHELVRALHDRGVTIVMITHSLEEAQTLASRIITLPEHAATPLSIVEEGEQGEARPASFVASLDPRVKMVAFLALMFTAFMIHTPVQLALSAALVAGIVAAARISPLRLLASIHMFLALFVMMGLLNVFFVRTGATLFTIASVPITTDGLSVAMLYICRFALVVILGAVLLESTTPTALADGFGSLLSPLHRVMHTQELALVMSLALRFLPILGRETRAIMDAQSARGGSIETGSPARRIKAMSAIIVPVFAGTLRHADNLSLALDARCYEEGARRTHWRLMRVKARDIAFGILAAVYIVALVVLGLM